MAGVKLATCSRLSRACGGIAEATTEGDFETRLWAARCAMVSDRWKAALESVLRDQLRTLNVGHIFLARRRVPIHYPMENGIHVKRLTRFETVIASPELRRPGSDRREAGGVVDGSGEPRAIKDHKRRA